jgi:hypothetical protein
MLGVESSFEQQHVDVLNFVNEALDFETVRKVVELRLVVNKQVLVGNEV